MPKRTDIRAAIKSLLMGLNTTDDRVYTSRTNPLDVPDSINIVSGFEGLFDIENGHNVRRYETILEIVASGDDLDDQLDTINGEIFAVLQGARLGGLTMDVRFLSADAPQLSGEGDTPIGLMNITYEAYYEID